MRTPVVLVAGQGDTDSATGTLMQRPGTVVVEHRFDGHVVRRTTAMLRRDELTTAEAVLELAHGCVACTIRNDLLVYLRVLHRRSDVQRIVVHLAPWLEPEPICLAINHVRVRIGEIQIPAGPQQRVAAPEAPAGDRVEDHVELGQPPLPAVLRVVQRVVRAEF